MMDRCLSPPMGWPPDALEPSRMPWSWRTVAEVTSSFLPALTLAAWSIKINVTAAISVESHRHLFVFHLVVHLCISMMRWAPAAVHKPGDFWFKKNKNRSLPQIQHKKKKCAYTTAPCVKVYLSQPDWALQIRSPLSPDLRLMVKGSHEKKRSAKALGSLRVAHREEAGQSAATLNLNRVEDTDTGKSSVHQITSRESCAGTRLPDGASLHPRAA